VFFVLGYLFRRWYFSLYGAKARPETLVVYAVSAYWIAMGAEQSLAIMVGLALSYVAVAAVLAIVARLGYSRFAARERLIA